MLGNTDRYRRHVLGAESFICTESSEFVNFYAGDTKLRTLVYLDKVFIVIYIVNLGWLLHVKCT